MKQHTTAPIIKTQAEPQAPCSPLEGEPKRSFNVLVGGIFAHITPHRKAQERFDSPSRGELGVCGTARLLLATFLIAATISLSSPALAAWQTPGVTTQEIAAAKIEPTNGVTTSVASSYFNITTEDVARAVAEQLQLQAVEQKADVNLNAGTPKVLYSANHPLKLVIHALQIDPASRRWQAQANIVSNGKTETVKPVAGTYSALVDVPVLTRQLGRNEIIEQSDLSTKSVPAHMLRKETITDASKLLGQSPRAIISSNRPIRQSEISSPILIKKGDAVQMTYTTPYISIKASGTALQDGSKGDMIRVKNDKSEKAVSGRVVEDGRIEVNAAL